MDKARVSNTNCLSKLAQLRRYKGFQLLNLSLPSAVAASARSNQDLIDPSIDPHFRSGVYLGNGMANIVLSLMPGKLMTVVEMFGYHGDRETGLELLMKAGGWGGKEGGEGE